MSWYDISGMQERGRMRREDYLSKMANRDAQSEYQKAMAEKMRRRPLGKDLSAKQIARATFEDAFATDILRKFQNENRMNSGVKNPLSPETALALLTKGSSGSLPEGIEAYRDQHNAVGPYALKVPYKDPSQTNQMWDSLEKGFTRETNLDPTNSFGWDWLNKKLGLNYNQSPHYTDDMMNYVKKTLGADKLAKMQALGKY